MNIVPLEAVLASLESGARPPGGASVDSGEIPSLGGEHLNADGGFDFTSLKRIPRSFFQNIRGGRIANRDILVVKDGATTGKTSFVGEGFPFHEAAVNEHVFCVRVDQSKACPEYVFHFLRSPRGQRSIALDFRGATVGGISRDFVRKVRFPLPPLPEQRRIAEILDKADALRAKRCAALAQLDTLTQSIFLDMFGNPATNPKGWPIKLFSAVCETRLGKMLDQKQQTGQHKRPYLRNANVQWFRFDLKSVFEMDFDQDDRETFRLRPGDLLICEGGEPGRSAVWRGEIAECYFQKALHRARPDPRIASAEYLSWLMWFLAQRGKLSGVTSATIAHLTGEKLAVLPVMLPAILVQQGFARHVAAVDHLKSAHYLVLAELDALFASLQHRAFRGEV